MIAMAQLASYRTYAAPRFNDVCVSHERFVRNQRTPVNVACVQHGRENAIMADSATIGQKINAMRERAGLSIRALAERAGYATGSGVQRFCAPDFDSPIEIKVAKRLIEAFKGTEVFPEEIWALANIPASPNGITVSLTSNNDLPDLQRDLPVYGTALGGVTEFDSVAVEQTNLSCGEVVHYLKRPAALKGRKDAYAVYIQGSSMSPRWQDGELAFVDPARPPMIGDDVLVFLRDSDGLDGEQITACLVKRLAARTAANVTLEQYSPPSTFQVPQERISKMHRVIPFSELFA